jgi:hypothetical protein
MRNILRKSYQIWVMVFLVAFLAASPVSTVSAALRTCRTDPIVMLSDGNNVSMSATMATEAGNVRQIAYALHVPSGVTVTKIVFTGGDWAKKEVVEVYSDLPNGKYRSETTVSTHSGSADVSATAKLKSGFFGTTRGRSGDRLVVDLTDPGSGPRNKIKNGNK